MANKCAQCDRDFKTTQALSSHIRFVHGARQHKQAPLSTPKRLITDEQLTKQLTTITQAVNQLYEFRKKQDKFNEEVITIFQNSKLKSPGSC
jgi:hypothetical protein